jgi:hypothetical protein
LPPAKGGEEKKKKKKKRVVDKSFAVFGTPLDVLYNGDVSRDAAGCDGNQFDADCGSGVGLVPRVLTVLLAIIDEHDGVNVDALFQGSPPKADADKLMRKIDAGDYDSLRRRCESPLMAAHLIKLWLQSVAPLLPADVHAECAGIVSNGGDEKEKQVLAVFDAAPEVVQNIMLMLSPMFASLVKSSTQSTTTHSLATIMAPLLLRAANGDAESDATDVRFVELLLGALSGDFSEISDSTAGGNTAGADVESTPVKTSDAARARAFSTSDDSSDDDA